jgi:hypothetical protein
MLEAECPNRHLSCVAEVLLEWLGRGRQRFRIRRELQRAEGAAGSTDSVRNCSEDPASLNPPVIAGVHVTSDLKLHPVGSESQRVD